MWQQVWLLLALATLSWGATYIKEWEEWKSLHRKVYIDKDEELHRRKVWEYNMQYIEDHNSLGESYELKMNEFGDLVR